MYTGGFYSVEDEADKQAFVQDPTTPFFTTEHFDGHPSVLVRAIRLHEITVQDAWLSQTSNRRAKPGSMNSPQPEQDPATSIVVARRLGDMDRTIAPITGEQWDRLVASGELDGPFELVGGRKITYVTENPPHVATLNLLRRQLQTILPPHLDLRMGNPLALGDFDRPEPDIAVVTYRKDAYAAHHPPSSDVHLVIEVSVSSLAIDLGDKAERYALAGIPEYWVVDVEQKAVVVHRDPQQDDGVWESITQVAFGSPLCPLALPGEILLPQGG